jgi:serine/threonine protein phosphatase PrpC
MTKKFYVSKIYDKGSAAMNEDELLIKDTLFAVFDGATSLSGWKSVEGKTGARMAAEIAKRIFSHNDGSLLELAKDANDALRCAMEKEGVDVTKKEALWSTTVAVVKIEGDMLQYLSNSDSLVLAIMRDGSYKLITPDHDHDVEMMVLWKDMAKKKIENIRSMLHDKIVALRQRVNRDYGVLNGEKEALLFCHCGTFSLKDVKTVLLFTDGLFLPKTDPRAASDWRKFVSLYQEKGLQGLLQYVRDVQRTDPHCWTYPRYKQHDDVAAIAIEF